MSIPGQRVRESFLLDREGRIVVRSSDRHDDPNLIEARSIEKPVLYPYSDIVADLQAGKSSYLSLIHIFATRCVSIAPVTRSSPRTVATPVLILIICTGKLPCKAHCLRKPGP